MVRAGKSEVCVRTRRRAEIVKLRDNSDEDRDAVLVMVMHREVLCIILLEMKVSRGSLIQRPFAELREWMRTSKTDEREFVLLEPRILKPGPLAMYTSFMS